VNSKQIQVEEKVAHFYSALFHPLLMPTYGCAIILFTQNPALLFFSNYLKFFVLGITFVFTFLLPTLNALILLKMGRIKSLRMEHPSERSIPFFTTAIYYYSLFYLFNSIDNFPSIFKLLILGAGNSILLAFFINKTWKISAHAIGLGGIIAALIAVSNVFQINLVPIISIAIILAGIVSFSRLRLNAHTPAQVYSGFFLGFLVMSLHLIFLNFV